MPDEPVWEEPPNVDTATGGPGPTGVWRRRLLPLMKRPGEWAYLGEHNGGMRTNLQKAADGTGLGYRIPPGRWEFTARGRRNGKYPKRHFHTHLYGRYLGPDEENPPPKKMPKTIIDILREQRGG